MTRPFNNDRNHQGNKIQFFIYKPITTQLNKRECKIPSLLRAMNHSRQSSNPWLYKVLTLSAQVNGQILVFPNAEIVIVMQFFIGLGLEYSPLKTRSFSTFFGD
jgi:hypothetical protein